MRKNSSFKSTLFQVSVYWVKVDFNDLIFSGSVFAQWYIGDSILQQPTNQLLLIYCITSH